MSTTLRVIHGDVDTTLASERDAARLRARAAESAVDEMLEIQLLFRRQRQQDLALIGTLKADIAALRADNRVLLDSVWRAQAECDRYRRQLRMVRILRWLVGRP